MTFEWKRTTIFGYAPESRDIFLATYQSGGPMKKALIVSFLTLLVSVPAVAISSEPERFYYRKGNERLVVILAQDNCCVYESGLKAAGWVPTTVQNRSTGFICYLTTGKVDMALACYRGQEKGRIGTRVIDTDPNGCSVKTLELLAGAGIDNIIQDFRKNGYPDGCAAAGCFGGSGGSPSD